MLRLVSQIGQACPTGLRQLFEPVDAPLHNHLPFRQF
jgi:hypothetical protein